MIRQLVAYKKFKDAAAQLQVREAEQENIFPRLPVRPETAAPAAPRQEASLFDLVNAVSAVLKRAGKREDLREIFEDKWTVSEKIEYLLKLTAEKAAVKFSELFGGADQPGGSGLHVSGLAGVDPAQATGLRAAGGFWGN